MQLFALPLCQEPKPQLRPKGRKQSQSSRSYRRSIGAKLLRGPDFVEITAPYDISKALRRSCCELWEVRTKLQRGLAGRGEARTECRDRETRKDVSSVDVQAILAPCPRRARADH